MSNEPYLIVLAYNLYILFLYVFNPKDLTSKYQAPYELIKHADHLLDRFVDGFYT